MLSVCLNGSSFLHMIGGIFNTRHVAALLLVTEVPTYLPNVQGLVLSPLTGSLNLRFGSVVGGIAARRSAPIAPAYLRR